jgi:hypothetical protein
VTAVARSDDGTPVSPPAPWYIQHRPFLVALGLGVLVRLLLHLAFSTAFNFSDGPTYLRFIHNFRLSHVRPAGYPLLVVYPLSLLSKKVIYIAVLQHLMGLATAVVLYALMRRWAVGSTVAVLATLPVLFDGMQLSLEHSVLSDTLFELLLVLAIAALGWNRRPTVGLALTAGLLFGVCVTVRLVGEPLILSGVGYCLLRGGRWRERVVTAAVLAAGFAVPLAAYATWYHTQHGVYAIAQFTGKSLYLRSTSFVECSRLSIPKYQRVLCPREPVGQRLDPTWYVWHSLETIPSLRPPPGVTKNEAIGEFARAAIKAQPLDYIRTVLRDFALNFDVKRVDRFEYDTAYKWRLAHFVVSPPTPRTVESYRHHGGDQLHVREPLGQVMALYGAVVYLPGPLLFGCLVLGLVGGFGVGRARDSGMRSICLLTSITGAGLLLLPDITQEFVWRYQLPGVALLPLSAALAHTALGGDLEKAARRLWRGRSGTGSDDEVTDDGNVGLVASPDAES